MEKSSAGVSKRRSVGGLMGGGGGQTFGETPEFNYIESLYVREGER